MDKKIVVTGLIFGLLAIILGAFGAHALKKILQPEQLVSFETGVKYLMYHSLFLLFLGNFNFILPEQRTIIFYLILFGTIFFSGSIFLLTTKPFGFDYKFLGPITPIGGLLLIAGWFLLILKILKN